MTIGHAIGAVSGVSILVAAIATLASWSFGRGLISGAGFPSSLVGLRNSIDFVPSIAFGYTSRFLFSMVLGYLIASLLTWKHTAILERVVTGAWFIVLICTLFIVVDSANASDFRSIVRSLATECAPLFVGYTVHSYLKEQFTLRFGIFALYAVYMSVIVWLSDLNRLGSDMGQMIRNNIWEITRDYHLTKLKYTDFPRVSIKTKEKLLDRASTPPIGDLYEYPMGNNFLRLMLADSANYYLVEGDGHSAATAFTLRKELVLSLTFVDENKGRKGGRR